MQKTFSIIKPDAVKRNLIGHINQIIESSGLKIIAIKMLYLDKDMAEGFYSEHKGKPFFDKLINFMTSGPVVVQVLSGENAIKVNRELMGHTNPEEASKGTIRSDFAESIDANAVHGSDSPKSAEREISYFFNESEIF